MTPTPSAFAGGPSTESLWGNYTLFDRVVRQLALHDVRVLSLDDGAVLEAADYLGLSVVRATLSRPL